MSIAMDLKLRTANSMSALQLAGTPAHLRPTGSGLTTTVFAGKPGTAEASASDPAHAAATETIDWGAIVAEQNAKATRLPAEPISASMSGVGHAVPSIFADAISELNSGLPGAGGASAEKADAGFDWNEVVAGVNREAGVAR